MIPQIANKACRSLKNRESEVVKEWLKSVIDDVDLPSLQAFPTRILSTALPRFISRMAENVAAPSGAALVSAEFRELTEHLAGIRKENATIVKVFEDYSRLRRLLVEAMAKDLRGSDRDLITVLSRLDNGFEPVFKYGLEFYVERRSEDLNRLAETDDLTGLFNMRYFRRRLHEDLEMFSRYQVPFSMMMIDIDRMKQLNDTEGHQMGDRALKHLAQAMTGQKRETDIAFRYGGDEFFLLMPGISVSEGESLALRIINEVKAIHESTGGREMTSVSIGIVSCPEDGAEVGLLRAHVDEALYLAKGMGGGAVARYRKKKG
jgi:diguanylate cyclase (GGDEF)-like protein